MNWQQDHGESSVSVSSVGAKVPSRSTPVGVGRNQCGPPSGPSIERAFPEWVMRARCSLDWTIESRRGEAPTTAPPRPTPVARANLVDHGMGLGHATKRALPDLPARLRHILTVPGRASSLPLFFFRAAFSEMTDTSIFWPGASINRW